MKKSNRLLFVLIPFVLGSAHAGEILISQKNKKFSVVEVEAKIGDVLVFKNDEKDLSHNVYSITEDNDFDLKTQKAGETSKIVLDGKSHKAGKMMIECAIHPTMKLVVNIKE